MTDTKAVTIILTVDQRNQIKEATGQDVFELRVGMVKGQDAPLAIGAVADRANPSLGIDAVEARANPRGFV